MKYATLFLFILFLLLQLLDIYLTNKCIKNNKGYEANPIVKFLQSNFKFYWFIPKIVVATVIGIFFLRLKLYGLIGLVMLCVVYIFVCFNNWKILKK